MESTFFNRAAAKVVSTFDHVTTVWGSNGMNRARSVASSVAKGAKLRGGWAYAQYGAGAVGGGAAGYYTSDPRSRGMGTAKGAALGALGVLGGKLGYSAYDNSLLRSEARGARAFGGSMYRRGRASAMRRGANIMEAARTPQQQMDHIRGFYGGEGY